MKTEHKNEVSIKDIAELMAYFLAGSLLIGGVLYSRPTCSAIEPMSWFTLVVGVIIIASGLIFALVSLPVNCLKEYREGFRSRWGNYVYALVFVIILTKVALTIIDFQNYCTLLFIVGIVFLVIILLIIILTSKQVFTDIRLLLMMVFLLTAIAIYLMFTMTNIIQPVIVLVLILGFIMLALYKVNKSSTPQ